MLPTSSIITAKSSGSTRTRLRPLLYGLFALLVLYAFVIFPRVTLSRPPILRITQFSHIEAVKRIMVDFPEALIIMISAHNEQSRVYEAIKCGAKNYIVKPIRSGTVIATIDKVLSKANASVDIAQD